VKSLAKILTLTLAFLASLPVSAQYKREKDATIPLEHFYIERQKGGLRHLLSKLHWGLSTGYGRIAFRHELDGLGIIQQPDSIPMIFNSVDPTIKQANWFNRVTPASTGQAAGSFLVNSDTADIGFRSRAFSIPLKATVHIELFEKYRIGGGYSYEFMHLRKFTPTNYDSDISSFEPEANNFFMKKYFGMLGGTVYRYYEYLLAVDVNIGGYKLGKNFDMGVIRKGVYYNLGVSAEREFSEYFRVFFRPSYELKKYRITVPEGGQEIVHHMNGWYINIGATYRLPELRRCFMKDCHAQLNHAHGNKEYRSRRHPIWKKQNPNYGENYPTLIKYKGKNKNKLNPY
jgi:hypothetical protein